MVRKKKSEQKLVLPEKLDASNFLEIFQAATAARGKPLLVDANALRQIGAQGVQLLLSIAGTWRQDGVAMRIVSVGDAFRDVLAVLGVAPALLSIEEVAQ